MSANDLLSVLRRQPFTPFALVTTDGTRYEIHHPEMLMPGRRSVTVGLPDNPAEAVYDKQVLISMLHVQRLEPLDTAKAPGNGKA